MPKLGLDGIALLLAGTAMAEFSEVVKAHKVTQEASVFPLLIERLDVGELENLGRMA